MKPRCAIFLSTYNGGEYLEQQIDSILNQKDIEVNLMIRDDGSTDNTLEIIGRYSEDPRIRISSGANMGHGQSFCMLMYSSDDSYDCYAFADQDDIWDEDKIIAGWNAMKKVDGPSLYFCSQRIIDERGEILGEDTSLGRIIKCTKYSASKTNLIRGCTMIWNKKMHSELLGHKPDINRIREHDIWVSWIAMCVGKVIFDDTSHMGYRQISSSTSPGAHKKGILSFFHKMQVMKYVWIKWSGLKYEYAEEIEKCFPDIKLATCHYKNDLRSILELFFSKKYNEGVPLKWRLMSDLMLVMGRL
ncbi:glycosyltransferase [Butyrivibrio sp. LB2008]|uniref:glycosyltransferase n=1 Tax=Butyrivibrio sp. LB2008 TaxID=1408305 RepID=UPI0004799015|nr:glycosyltransferase [Butyrivibrio sp. LB2008]